MFLLEYKTLTHIYFKMYSERSHSENYWWRSHNIFFLIKTCQWACSFSPSEFSSDQNVGLGIRKLPFCCSQWVSHWASPRCAQSWVGNNKILSFMYDKNWSTKNTNGRLRAQWMMSGECRPLLGPGLLHPLLSAAWKQGQTQLNLHTSHIALATVCRY